MTKKYTRVERADIISISEISRDNENDGRKVQWQWSFVLETVKRNYRLFAPTREERDLWVDAFNRLQNILIRDTNFQPLKALTKDTLNMHEQFQLTQGNSGM